MPSLIEACYAIFGYQWEACSFLEGNGEAVDLGKRRGRGGGVGGGEGGEAVVEMYYMIEDDKKGMLPGKRDVMIIILILYGRKIENEGPVL